MCGRWQLAGCCGDGGMSNAGATCEWRRTTTRAGPHDAAAATPASHACICQRNPWTVTSTSVRCRAERGACTLGRKLGRAASKQLAVRACNRASKQASAHVCACVLCAHVARVHCELHGCTHAQFCLGWLVCDKATACGCMPREPLRVAASPMSGTMVDDPIGIYIGCMARRCLHTGAWQARGAVYTADMVSWGVSQQWVHIHLHAGTDRIAGPAAPNMHRMWNSAGTKRDGHPKRSGA